MIGGQRLHSFITLRFRTPPQVILNLAIQQLHLPNPLPLSSAINHHPATGQWAQSKVTVHPASIARWEREKDGGGMREGKKTEERVIGREQGGEKEREPV